MTTKLSKIISMLTVIGIVISILTVINLVFTIYIISSKDSLIKFNYFNNATCIEQEKFNYTSTICKTLCDNSNKHNLYSIPPLAEELKLSFHLFQENLTCEEIKEYFIINNRNFGGILKLGIDCYQNIVEIESSKCKIYQNKYGLMAIESVALELGLKKLGDKNY